MKDMLAASGPRENTEESKPFADRRFSVLLPLLWKEGKWHVLFEQRSSRLSHHPGEIALPGGAVERGESITEAAVRETCEEVGTNPSDIRIICEIEGTVPTWGGYVHCTVGVLGDRFNIPEFAPREEEVAGLFTVPAEFFKGGYKTEYLEADSGVLVKSHTFEYKDRVIWGITGRLIKNFLDCYDKIFKIVDSLEEQA